MKIVCWIFTAPLHSPGEKLESCAESNEEREGPERKLSPGKVATGSIYFYSDKQMDWTREQRQANNSTGGFNF